MKMQKVFFKGIFAVVVGLCFLAAVGKFVKSPEVGSLLLVIFGALGFLVFLFYSIFPIWSFDKNGFEKNIFFIIRNKYKWEDVNSVNASSIGDALSILTNNNDRVMLSRTLTKNYSRVLYEVITIIQEKNPKIEIPPSILGQVKK
jgi:hypothetical protein